MLDRKFNIFVILFLITAMAIPAAISDSRYVVSHLSAAPMPTPALSPPYSAYKGVGIGTAMSEARTKLGEPKEKSDTQDFYSLSDNESVLVYYGAAKTVTAITVTFTGKLEAAPTARVLFGEDVAPKPDGGIFKMVRYPKAGFWISYNKIVGDDPVIMIAMQKM